MILSLKTHWLNGLMKCDNLKAVSLIVETNDELKFIHDTLYYVEADVYFYTGAEDFMRSILFSTDFLKTFIIHITKISYFKTGGYLEWFRSNNSRVPDELLCERTQTTSRRVSFVESFLPHGGGEIKKAGVYDVERKCIEAVDANLKYHTVCERNCTQFDCLQLKGRHRRRNKTRFLNTSVLEIKSNKHDGMSSLQGLRLPFLWS